MYSACQEGHEQIVKVLIQAGASLNSQQPLVCFIYTSVKIIFAITFMQQTGTVPLHVVSDHGSATIAQLLIEAGANVDIPNSVC